MAVLPTPARLLSVFVRDRCLPDDSFAVGNAGQSGIEIYIELPGNTFNCQVDMDIAKAVKDGLRRGGVPFNFESGVLFSDPAQRIGHLVEIGRCARRHSQGEHWRWQVDTDQLHIFALVGKRVECLGVVQTRDDADITTDDLVDRFVFLASRPVYLAHPFVFALVDVPERCVRFQRCAIYTEI